MRPSPSIRGFTAIELVTAMTILMGMTAMLGMIMARGERIWTRSIEMNRTRQTGRNVLEFLTRDLSHAVTDDRLPFVIDAGLLIEDYRSVHLRFCTLLPEPVSVRDMSRRTIVAVAYWLEEATGAHGAAATLMRGRLVSTRVNDPSADDNLYWRHDWVDAESMIQGEPVARHVTAFRVSGAADNPLDEPGAYEYDSRDMTNRAPSSVDVFLEVLSPLQARQLGMLPPDRRASFIEQNAVRFTSRIHIANRSGRETRIIHE